MYQVVTQIGDKMPISLVLLSNGTVAFIKTNTVGVLFDHPEDPDGIKAAFDENSFTLGDENFNYQTAYDYKSIEVMLSWLCQQNLQQPHVMFG